MDYYERGFAYWAWVPRLDVLLLGTARANGPFGLPTGLPVRFGVPSNGGPFTTAGGLVFIAAATDNLIRAIDIHTGKVVWSDVLPAGGQATPMTYESNGRQYLVIALGGHRYMNTRYRSRINNSC